jgi:hypothetical protein
MVYSNNAHIQYNNNVHIQYNNNVHIQLLQASKKNSATINDIKK